MHLCQSVQWLYGGQYVHDCYIFCLNRIIPPIELLVLFVCPLINYLVTVFLPIHGLSFSFQAAVYDSIVLAMESIRSYGCFIGGLFSEAYVYTH